MIEKMAKENTSTPTKDILDKCKLDLCKEKVALNSAKDAKVIDFNAQKDIVQRYKICCLVKAEETNKLYRHVDYQVAIRSVKESKLIQEKVKGMGDMYTALDKNFKDLVKKIQDTKKKMEDAVEAAEKLDRCIDEEERCNPGLFQVLGEVKVETSGPSTDPPGNGETDIWTFINDKVKSKTDDCYDKLLDAYDASIEVAGIMTFINIDSLKPGADKVAELVAGFRKDIEENTKSSAGAMDTATKELAKSMEEMVAIRFEKCAAVTQAQGVANTYSWLCDPECPEDGDETLRDICEQLKAGCDTGTAGGEDECEEEEPTQRRRKRRRKSEWEEGLS